jgi:hypothetical protein
VWRGISLLLTLIGQSRVKRIPFLGQIACHLDKKTSKGPAVSDAAQQSCHHRTGLVPIKPGLKPRLAQVQSSSRSPQITWRSRRAPNAARSAAPLTWLSYPGIESWLVNQCRSLRPTATAVNTAARAPQHLTTGKKPPYLFPVSRGVPALTERIEVPRPLELRTGMSTSTRSGALPSVRVSAPVKASSGGFPVSRRHCGETPLL